MEIGENEFYIMNEFEKFTKQMPKFFFEVDGTFVFLVEGSIQAARIPDLSRRLAKPILVVQDSGDPESLVRNLFKNVNLLNIKVDPARLQVHVNVAEKDRSLAIGRGGTRIKVGKKLLKDKFGYDILLHYTMMQ